MPQRLLRNLTCLFALCVPFLAHGQTARFTGQVTDQQGAAVPNADVEVIDHETGKSLSATTDKSGDYTVPFLPAGKYQVVVKATGFAPSVNNDIAVAVGQAFVLNIQLAVEGTTSNVEVTGNSEVTQVNTENAEMSGTITGTEVAGILLNGRNYSQFLALAPGVSNQTGQDEARVGMAGSVSYAIKRRTNRVQRFSRGRFRDAERRHQQRPHLSHCYAQHRRHSGDQGSHPPTMAHSIRAPRRHKHCHHQVGHGSLSRQSV